MHKLPKITFDEQTKQVVFDVQTRQTYGPVPDTTKPMGQALQE